MNTDANAQQDAEATDKLAWEKPDLMTLDARMSDITSHGGPNNDASSSSLTVAS